MGIKEFMDKLHEEDYDPDHIYTIWDKMWSDEETRKLMQNNIDCGVCKEGYFRKPDSKEVEEVLEEVKNDIIDDIKEIAENN